jgi:[ribosomal protein S5]-alanine N-acetyltransferase
MRGENMARGATFCGRRSRARLPAVDGVGEAMHNCSPMQASHTPTLETARLILRPASVSDCAQLQPLFADWDIVKELNAGVPWPFPQDGLLSYTRDCVLPDMADGSAHTWTLFEKETGDAVGRLELMVERDSDDELNRGFWLGKRFHGRGYMTEAVVVTTDFAFDELAMPSLLLGNAQSNVASSKLKRRAGARLLGVAEHDYVCGRLLRELWSLSPADWRVSPLKRGA